MLSCVLAVRFCFSSMKPEVVTDNVKMAPALIQFILVVNVSFKAFIK